MTTLDDLAPWPGMSGECTADILARHMAVSALAHFALLHNFKGSDAEWGRHAAHGASAYGITFLLRALSANAASDADKVASELRDRWEDAEDSDETLATWLTSYGISPEQVIQLARAHASAQRRRPGDKAVDRDGMTWTYVDAGGQDLMLVSVSAMGVFTEVEVIERVGPLAPVQLDAGEVRGGTQ